MNFLVIQKTGRVIDIWNFMWFICKWQNILHVYFVAHHLIMMANEV